MTKIFSKESTSSLFGLQEPSEGEESGFCLLYDTHCLSRPFFHCFIIIFRRNSFVSLYIVFTFNNNKINIGWMRNELQTSTQAHVLDLSLSPLSLFRKINFAFHKALRLLSSDNYCRRFVMEIDKPSLARVRNKVIKWSDNMSEIE